MLLFNIFSNSKLSLANSNEYQATDFRGSLYRLDIQEQKLLSYEEYRDYGCVDVGGVYLRVKMSRHSNYSDSKLVESGAVFSEPRATWDNMDDRTKYAILRDTRRNDYSLNRFLTADLKVINRTFTTIVFNKLKVKLKEVPGEDSYLDKPIFMSDEIFCSHWGTSFGLGDTDFKIVGEVDAKIESSELKADQKLWNIEGRRVCLSGDTLIASLGSIRKERESDTIVAYEDAGGEHMAPDPYYTDGHLYGINANTGEQQWLQVFDYQVEDFEILPNGKLVVISERNLYLLDPETGAIEQQFDTGIRKKERIETVSMRVFLHKDQLYITSLKDQVMQIRDANSLKLLREVDGREHKWGFGKYRPQAAGDIVLIPVELGKSPFTGGAMLLIDSNNLDAELQIEQGPEFEEVIPSKENPGPIKVKVHHPDWGLVVRFAERRLLELVMLTSDRSKYKYFKPRKIEFEYSGYKDDVELVQEKMDIFVERFKHYLAEPHVPGIGFQPVELVYTLS